MSEMFRGFSSAMMETLWGAIAQREEEIYDIRSALTEDVLMDQLAEEAAELSVAALKVARILRDENPTPVMIEEARENLKNEFTDVLVAAFACNVRPDMDIAANKLERWYGRLFDKCE